MVHKEFEFTFYNTNFYGQYWQATITKAVVILLHGMGEHSGRYANFFVPRLLKNNISIFTYDQFGHGRTQGKKGHNPGFNYLLDCIEIISKKARQVFNDVPYFLYGHSMGGNVVLNYLLKRKNYFTGFVATSPFLRLAFNPPSWQLKLGKFLYKTAPYVTISSGLEAEAISRDQSEVQKYLNDPLVHDRISPNYSITMMNSGEWVINNAHKISKSVLLLHGTSDRLTSYEATKEFYENANEFVTLRLIENGYHELHNDYCKEDMMEIIINWINTQLRNKKSK